MRGDQQRPIEPLDEEDTEEWLPGDTELTAGGEEPAAEWDGEESVVDADDSLTPESLEEEMEGYTGAPEEDALHDSDAVSEAVHDEGTSLEGLDADELEVAIDEDTEASESPTRGT